MAKLPVAVVVGVGPGLGLAVSKRFAAGGYHVALMARDKGKLDASALEIKAEGKGDATAIECNSTDKASVAAAFEAARALGDVDVLVYNAAGGFKWPPPKFHELTADSFEASFQVNCLGAFLCCQEVVPGMLSRSHGTILFTGATAAVRGSAGFAPFATGAFAKRALAQSMARELHPQGVHVALVIVDGIINTPRVRSMMPDRDPDSLLSPEAMAESYWMLHSQHKTAWSHEIDLRPSLEKF